MSHREKAAKYQKRVEDSFERSDTDGFLSQWANGLHARLEERLAEIEEAIEGRSNTLMEEAGFKVEDPRRA